MAKLIKKEEPNIIFSTDPKEKTKKKAPELGELNPKDHTLKIRLETNKRGGKAVSVVFELPNHPPYFKKLTKKLKSSCGTGGSFQGETMEIQGDHREKLKTLLENLGFEVKLAGGR